MVEGLSHCLRHEATAKESAHLLAFALLHTKQNKLAAAAFWKSIKLGNETDWQPLVEVRRRIETDTVTNELGATIVSHNLIPSASSPSHCMSLFFFSCASSNRN